MQHVEKTLILLKPDAMGRGLAGEIITRFERVGLKIVGAKMVWPDKDFYMHHYEGISQMITRRGQKAFDITMDLMVQSPVLAIVLEGVHAVELVRKMVGATEPKSALPGTIRGDYAHVSFAHADAMSRGIPNLIHASGNAEEAAAELAHWFKADELFSYDSKHTHYTI